MLAYQDKKFIVWTDFDGTVTTKDSNDFMIDNFGCGAAKRKELNAKLLRHETTFREIFRYMIDSVAQPFDACVEQLLTHIKLDPGFADFYRYCRANDVPVVVLSSGMKPIIRKLLAKLMGDEANEIEVVSSDVEVDPSTGKFHIVFHDESGFGHDKSRAIKPYAELPDDKRPGMVYCGDGVSDLSAARETNLLFAKAGRDLVGYCEREGMPHHVFTSFQDIHTRVRDIFEGRETLPPLGAREY